MKALENWTGRAEETRRLLRRHMDLAPAVFSAKQPLATLEAKNRNVSERRFGPSAASKDCGTTGIELEDACEKTGAQMVREAASETSHDSGEGTTTATLLVEGQYAEGSELVTALELILLQCFKRIDHWRTPSNWSPDGWIQELRA